MQKLDPKVTNTTALAYMGDAVYEVFIREYVLEQGPDGSAAGSSAAGRGSVNAAVDSAAAGHRSAWNVNAMNRRAVRFVCADGQARSVRNMLSAGFLTEAEERLVKRARNNTRTPKPRGTAPIDYKLATGFEALVGYLHLAGETDRLEEVVAEAIRIVEEEI